MQPQLGLTINLISCVNAYEGQKTNHKHHIHVKCSKCSFFQSCSIWQVSILILSYGLQLQGANLICVVTYD